MKTFITLLTFVLMVMACGDRSTHQTKVRKVPSNTSQPFDIRGIWSIKKYCFSAISAMDEKMADEWLNRKVFIDDKLHFDFQKITFYKHIFQSENECTLININQPESSSVNEYFDKIRDPLTELNIKNPTIKIYRTTCKDHPFSAFVLNEAREIIFRWDGAFFILTKDKN